MKGNEMQLPHIAMIDEDGNATDLDTANVEDLSDSYTASELAVMSALIDVAAHKVASAKHRLHQQVYREPMPIHPGF